jgi:ATP-dependent RNA helicase DDX51/DBP6
VINKIL